MTITLRPAVRADLFAVLCLIKEGGSADNPTYPSFLPPPEPEITHVMVERQMRAGLVRVAVNEAANIVGVLVTSNETFAWGHLQFLNALFVYLIPEARQGTDGLLLIDELRRMGQEAKLPVIVTIHEHDRTAGHAALLERCGASLAGFIYMFKTEA